MLESLSIRFYGQIDLSSLMKMIKYLALFIFSQKFECLFTFGQAEIKRRVGGALGEWDETESKTEFLQLKGIVVAKQKL